MEIPPSGSMPILSLFGSMIVLATLPLAALAPLFLNDGVVMDDWLVLKPRPGTGCDFFLPRNGWKSKTRPALAVRIRLRRSLSSCS
jgi:hypothetical protein